MFTTDCASIGLRGVAPLPNEDLFLALPRAFPVGVKVTEGKVLVFVVEGPIAGAMVVEPKMKNMINGMYQYLTVGLFGVKNR